MKLYKTTYLLFILQTIYCQNLSRQFGNFSEAVSFAVNNIGYIYVCDSGNNEVIKFDSRGKKIVSIGGYGWEASAFDYPSHVFASPLNVYVTDKNNNRIQIFDKDLNYLSSINSDENTDSDYSFHYPSETVVSGIGDLFILDSDNSRILKFDLKGNFILEIGGNNADESSLSDPESFVISKYLKLFVVDDNKIIVFDQYGNFLSEFEFEFTIKKVNAFENYLLLINNSEIIIYNVNELNKDLFHVSNKQLNSKDEIKDAILKNNKLYVLFPTQINVYDFVIK
ncbi:MAG: NHL repeat-containing protein [Ignavibacteria bacterium]|jgi:hypothetical protein